MEYLGADARVYGVLGGLFCRKSGGDDISHGSLLPCLLHSHYPFVEHAHCSDGQRALGQLRIKGVCQNPGKAEIRTRQMGF